METSNKFSSRHIGPRGAEIDAMLQAVGAASLDELIRQTIPASILLPEPIAMRAEGMTEHEYLAHVRRLAAKNRVFRSFIGQGYYETAVPSAVVRNVLESPTWYTSYTPYQAEISQGRLEALLNFQTMISDLTALPIANCSLLDEGTAANEAMMMFHAKRDRAQVKAGANKLAVDRDVFEQTKCLLEAKAEVQGIEIEYVDALTHEFDARTFGVIVQYPTARGEIRDYRAMAERAHAAGAKVAAAADLLSLTVLLPPGAWGADVAFGSSQRFGTPMGYGGPHAAYFAVTDDYKRHIPGRIIGVSVDRDGNKALRLALQTREQHIKREKATSNICTAQALMAVMAGMFAVYHGPKGLKAIARNAHHLASELNAQIAGLGYKQSNKSFFDTLHIEIPAGVEMGKIRQLALEAEMNFNYIDDRHLGISMNETNTLADLNDILRVLATAAGKAAPEVAAASCHHEIPAEMHRQDAYLQAEVFNSHHSETELMRYIHKLERRDIALNHSMIPLGSCTMKLNSASSMFAISWPEFNALHPFAPADQAEGYRQLLGEVMDDLRAITGFDGVSLQPTSGAHGEYSALRVIRAYQKAAGQGHRDVALIPASAHGTNPASAVANGLTTVTVACDAKGNVDVDDLRAKAEANRDRLSVFMITYPSTHGVFEARIREMIDIAHANGAQVFMDGANMNGQIGLTNPGFIGADICHLNLHKSFGNPHGGGGPGVGPICCAKHLTPYLPGHPRAEQPTDPKAVKAVSAAPYGSASIVPICHAYIKMLGAEGLAQSTRIAILSANYIACKLRGTYQIVYSGETGRCGHETILDCRDFFQKYGVDSTDIAKRLMDYGFHAPTLSFPVHDTLMVEPTESEPLQELDRFIETMKTIKAEMESITDKEDNVLRNAPHTAFEVAGDNWTHPYSREQAGFPLPWVRENKLWPYVSRVDNGYGDRNLVCTCAGFGE